MKTIPVTLQNINLCLELSVDDSEQTLSEIIQTIADIRLKLGDLGETSLIERFTKILPGTLIKSLSITDAANASSSPVNIISDAIAASPDPRDYILKSHKVAGQHIRNISPESLFALLDLSPWELIDSDQQAIREFRSTYRQTNNSEDLGLVPLSEDELI